MPTHLNSLTPMRISGTPRSFLNLDSRCPTSIDAIVIAIVIGGGQDNPLPRLGGWSVSMNMLSSLSVVARSSSARYLSLAASSGSIQVAARTVGICAIGPMGQGNKLVHGYRSR
jgi:hypothetical protein